jgi:hypothetical protein
MTSVMEGNIYVIYLWNIQYLQREINLEIHAAHLGFPIYQTCSYGKNCYIKESDSYGTNTHNKIGIIFSLGQMLH